MQAVREKYRLGRNMVTGSGRVVHRYDPTKYRQVVGELGKCYGGDANQVLDFVSTWGLLGVHGRDESEFLSWIWDHAGNVRLALEIIRYLQRGDDRLLESLLKPYEEWDPEREILEPSIHLNIASRLRRTTLKDFPLKEPTALGRDIVSFIVKENVEAEFAGRRLDLESTLLTAVYRHLDRAVRGEWSIARCNDPACRALFMVRGGRRQRYCPAPPPWAARTESLCALRDRRREWVRRQKQRAGGGAGRKGG